MTSHASLLAARSQHALSPDGAADGGHRAVSAEHFQQRVITAAACELYRTFLVPRPELKNKAGVIFHVAAEPCREADLVRRDAKRFQGSQTRLHRRKRRIERDASIARQGADFRQR